MGGKILEYEAKTILNQGIDQGIRQGIDQGIGQQAQRTARRMLAAGCYGQKEIAELNDLSLTDVEELAREMRRNG